MLLGSAPLSYAHHKVEPQNGHHCTLSAPLIALYLEVIRKVDPEPLQIDSERSKLGDHIAIKKNTPVGVPTSI